MVAHFYHDQAGHRVVVYQSTRSFPWAHGARPNADGMTWTAQLDGATLYCADEPVPSLVVGDDHQEVAMAAIELGLK